MPSTFIFGGLESKKRSWEIPFPKSTVCSDVMLDKVGLSYKSFFPSKNADSLTLKVADGRPHW